MKFIQILICCCIIFTFGCIENKDLKCVPYFDFDNIEHFKIEISNKEIIELKLNENNTKKDMKLLDILCKNLPDTITQLKVLDSLESLGYKKSIILENKFNEINSIFCERKHIDTSYTLAVISYRDIFVFKKLNKIVGIAKVDFECKKSWIIGTAKNTKEFGLQGDYDKLNNNLQKN